MLRRLFAWLRPPVPAADTAPEIPGSIDHVAQAEAAVEAPVSPPPPPQYVPPPHPGQRTLDTIKNAMAVGKDVVELASGGANICTAHHGGGGAGAGYVLDVQQFHSSAEIDQYLRTTSIWQGRNCLDWCDDPDPLVRALYHRELAQTGERERQQLYAQGGMVRVREVILQRVRETLARARRQQEAAAHPWRTWFRRWLPGFWTKE